MIWKEQRLTTFLAPIAFFEFGLRRKAGLKEITRVVISQKGEDRANPLDE